jgi:hypothetical protein
MEILLALMLGLLLAFIGGVTALRVRAWMIRVITRVTHAHVEHALKTLKPELMAELKIFCARLKTDLQRIDENMLANRTEKPQNTVAPVPEAVRPKEPPFWKNKERLKQAQDAIEQGEFDTEVTELNGMTQLEAMREIDDALLRLTIETDDDAVIQS